MGRTHSYFWSPEDLAGLLEEARKLRQDYEHRILDNQFVPTEVRLSAADRIDNLDIAIRLLGDRVD